MLLYIKVKLTSLYNNYKNTKLGNRFIYYFQNLLFTNSETLAISLCFYKSEVNIVFGNGNNQIYA